MMGKILVIGSVHIDILAEVDPSTSGNLDKIGQLRYSVGGTAFNVAANLAFHNKEVAVYSYLKEDSFSGDVIRSELSRRGLSTKWVRDTRMAAESGFVAHMQANTLVSAVSCIGIQDISFEEKNLRDAIRGCALVAVECNLAKDQITQLARLAAKEKKPLCVCAVSESKVLRIYNAINSQKEPIFRFVILNDLELKKVSGGGTEIANASTCKAFSTEYLIVTKGRGGFSVVSCDGQVRDFEVTIENVVSTIGAGDALFAAFCDHFSERTALDAEHITNDAKRFLSPVLGSINATPDIKKPAQKRYIPTELASVVALSSLLISVACVIYGLFSPELHKFYFGILLFSTTILSGLAGGHVERILNYREPTPYSLAQRDNLLIRSTLGIAAGLVAGIIFFMPQLIGSSEFRDLCANCNVPFHVKILLPFALITGLIGGLTSDALLKRLRTSDALKYDSSKIDAS